MRVQLVVPGVAVTGRMVRSRQSVVMTFFFLIDAKPYEQQTCLLAVPVEMQAINAVQLARYCVNRKDMTSSFCILFHPYCSTQR